MQRNAELERVADVFVGDWTMTLTNMWWLADPSTVGTGRAACTWLGDSFLQLEAELNGAPGWRFVFGRSDARDEFVVLYHDERGVQRLFTLTLDDAGWTMHRADPDFHQRLSARLDGDRMVGLTEASEDEGASWRKDFDLVWERA